MYAIAQQCLKYNTSLLGAAFVTLLLFLMMTFLIHSDDEREQIRTVIPIVDATMPEIVEIIIPPIERPQIIEEPPLIDAPPDNREVSFGGPQVAFIDIGVIEVDIPEMSGITLTDSSMVPLVRGTATYPSRALQNHVEGFVIVAFTVNEQGNVTEPRIVYAEPEGYFERSALQSIEKWRYAPKIENGKPVSVRDVQQRITFEIRE